MSIYANMAAARDMGIDKHHAISRRMEYLTDRKLYLDELIEQWSTYYFDHGRTPEDEEFCFNAVCLHLSERDKIDAEIEAIKRIGRDPQSGIDSAMIEQARRVSVTRVVEFRNKKATAWCHPDKNPSLVYLDRTGKAWCPVCDKHFDAIAVLMERDGMGFRDAIKTLVGV